MKLLKVSDRTLVSISATVAFRVTLGMLVSCSCLWTLVTSISVSAKLSLVLRVNMSFLSSLQLCRARNRVMVRTV